MIHFAACRPYRVAGAPPPPPSPPQDFVPHTLSSHTYTLSFIYQSLP
jgi:hypothetical protein